MTSLVQIRGLTKVYHRGRERVEALHGIDLDISEGDFVALMGPSGSGKTTLLNLIGGLDTPTEGVIARGAVQGALGAAEIVGVATLPSARRRGLGAAVSGARRAQVGAHAGADVDALADVHHLPMGVLEQVHTWTGRQAGDLCLVYSALSSRAADWLVLNPQQG